MRQDTFDELSLTLHDSDPKKLKVELHGRSTSREPGRVLVPWFSTVLGAAEKAQATLEVHFEKLEHFNSSTIAALIQVINQAQSHKVPLIVSYDGKLRWQSLSFEALKRAMKPFESGKSPVTFVDAPQPA